MSRIEAKVPPFEYLKGREFTEKLKEVTGCKTYELMSDYYGIPSSTFSTWHHHDRTGFELIVREHLKSGASVRYLALGEGEPFDNKQAPTDSIAVNIIANGKLEERDLLSIDSTTLGSYGLEANKTIVIDLDGQRVFINTGETHPTSGRYLIEIDGSHSVNQIQRLPGKKLAISFGNSTLDVSQDDIHVLGRVTMSMNKE